MERAFGIQIGGYGDGTRGCALPAASYLTADHKAPNVNLPNVVTVTSRWPISFKDGIAPPLGTYSVMMPAPAAFAAGKLATLSSDLATSTTLPNPVPFKWKLLPYPPGPVSQVNFNDITYYMVNAKSGDSEPDVGSAEMVDQAARERRLLGR